MKDIALPNDHQEEGVLIQPEPRYVIKTKLRSADAEDDKLFINVCVSSAIAEPSTRKRLDAEGKEVEGLNVPVSVGSLRSCMDKAGKSALAIDVIVSPKIIEDNKEERATDSSPLGGNRDFLNQFIMQCVEQKCNAPTSLRGQPPPSDLTGAHGGRRSVTVDRKYTLPKLLYQGHVHSLTGLPVAKSSEFAEVAKQMVRDAKKQPVIEEVEAPRSTASPTRIGVSESSEASEPMLSIECSMSIETADGTTKPVSVFIQDANASLGEGVVVAVVDPALSSQSHSRLLLISDASKANSDPAVQAKVVHIECQVACCSDPETIRVDVSAYTVSVSSKDHATTECIIPFPIDTGSTSCSYKATSSTLSIQATVVADDTVDRPDVGSHPWMLQKGLSSKKEKNSGDIGSGKNNEKREDKKSTMSRLRDDDDDDDDIFPEDRFHARDAYSQHMLLKQKEEQSGESAETANGPEGDASTATTSTIGTRDIGNCMELF